MPNYFKGSPSNPYHLSIGAVVINEKNEVCCHHFDSVTLRNVFVELKNFYILMRETVEMGETIEETLHRGLMEEFGITGDIVTFLGSIKGHYPLEGVSVEKTTLYFLVKLKTFDPKLRSKKDEESESSIEWQTIDYLIPKMQEQGERLRRTDLNEAPILERAKIYL